MSNPCVCIETLKKQTQQKGVNMDINQVSVFNDKGDGPITASVGTGMNWDVRVTLQGGNHGSHINLYMSRLDWIALKNSILSEDAKMCQGDVC